MSQATPSLIDVVAGCLGVRPDEIEPTVPLWRYGLDSLAAVQLHVELSAVAQRELPDGLLLQCSDVASLERFLTVGRTDELRAERLEQMKTDSLLPPEIRQVPIDVHRAECRSVLLTGATGFLGAHLLEALARNEQTRIVCLVRSPRGLDGRSRLTRALSSHRIPQGALSPRVEIVEGDLSCARFGLSDNAFETLSREIDTIYHVAAAVDWVQPYEALRATNVAGTMEILRLACSRRAKPVHFISTIGVCLATPGPDAVSEDHDALQNLEGLHFGYVQSKCVAETLMRRAGEHGLPVTVYRPSLISGHSRRGIWETYGFLPSFLKGCIRMQCAPDLDWMLDCCPVDHVAASVTGLSSCDATGLRVFHLDNPDSRHWRECVLWLNLYGYPVRLLPYHEWLRRLEEEAGEPEHPLHSLRSFFCWRPAGLGGLTLPELYEQSRKSRVDSEATRKALAACSLRSPSLSAHLLDRYFNSFVRRGFLTPPGRATRRPRAADNGQFGAAEFAQVFRRFYHDETLRITGVSEQGRGSEHSIVTELSSWRHGRAQGLSRHRVEFARGNGGGVTTLDVMVKMKPQDSELIEIGQSVADLCDPAVGKAYGRFKHSIGLDGSHLRELAIYEQQDREFRRHTPICYGILRNDRRRRWTLVLERLSGTVLMDSADDVEKWGREHIEAAIDGLAKLHGLWYGRETELLRQPWLGQVFSARTMAQTVGLWKALAAHAAPLFVEWTGNYLRTLQKERIDSVGRWWRGLEPDPRTLIHNDFNPRNITFRETEAGLRLCAYDWELATVGAPQHDLAELLCFVLTPRSTGDEVDHYVELHRASLEQATGRVVDASQWRVGFELSLDDLLINRFGMYAMIHTFRPLKFLERVVQTWWMIHQHLSRSSR
jgi:thioester reductase-like protein